VCQSVSECALLLIHVLDHVLCQWSPSSVALDEVAFALDEMSFRFFRLCVLKSLGRAC
jgi:hypothetical protein